MTGIAEGLAACLSERWGRDVTVANVSTTTAGARRQNLVFDAFDGLDTRRLVATILPAGETALNPIDVEASTRLVAASSGVPVPHVHAVEVRDDRLGAPFMISEHVAGETIPRRVLRLIAEHGSGDRTADQLGGALARLHAIDLASAPRGLQTVGGAPAEHAIAAMTEHIAALPHQRPALAFGLRWLDRHVPPPPPQPAIVHSDARNGNLIVGPEGLRAVLDWEGAFAGGDPMQDLAWPALRMWRFGEDALEIGGFAGRDRLIAGYEDADGTYDEDRFRWWKVQGTLKWALGLAAQSMAYVERRAPSIVMAASGRRVPELEWDLLMLTRS